MPKLNDRLLYLRNAKGILQKDLATALGISLLGYQRYEYGTRKPTSDLIIKMAKYFGVSTDYLLGLSDDPTIR